MGAKYIRNITKILKSASGVLFGRSTAGTGRGEELTPTQVRSLLSVYTVAQTDTAISTAVNNLIAGSPGLLDTLDELAAALGDDANFASTVTTALAGKVNTSDLSESIDDRVAALLVAGTNITLTYNDAAGTLTVASTAGGMAIGSSVTSATAGSIFFAGAAGILAQDNASLFFDDANNRLGVGTAAPTQPLDVSNTGTAGQIRYRWASDQSLGFGGDGMQGPYLVSHTNPNDTSFGNYAAIKLNFGAGGLIVSMSPSTSVGAARTFSELCRISTTTQIGLLTCTSASLKGLVVKAAASQSANLQEWQNSSGTALSVIRPNGGIGVASLADADAASSTLYYSTDAAKLVWKDAGGVVNNLY